MTGNLDTVSTKPKNPRWWLHSLAGLAAGSDDGTHQAGRWTKAIRKKNSLVSEARQIGGHELVFVPEPESGRGNAHLQVNRTVFGETAPLEFPCPDAAHDFVNDLSDGELRALASTSDGICLLGAACAEMSREGLSRDEIKQVMRIAVAIKEGLGQLGNNDCHGLAVELIDRIHGATSDERRELLRGIIGAEPFRAALNSGFGEDALEVMGSLLEDSPRWSNPVMNDFYRHYIEEGKTGFLPLDATMRCWESILYAGLLAGQISADGIVHLYERIDRVRGQADAIWLDLVFCGKDRCTDSRLPASKLKFYVQPGEKIPSHVALSRGDGVVVSLWSRANGDQVADRRRVQDIPGKLRVDDCSW